MLNYNPSIPQRAFDIINTFDIEYLLLIPDDIFQHLFLQYLSIEDIRQFDNAITNRKHRSQYLAKIANSVLLHVNHRFYGTNSSMLQWLKNKKLYLISISFQEVVLTESLIIDIREIFRHCESLSFYATNTIDSNTLNLIISECVKLKSLTLSNDFCNNMFTTNCAGLQSLSLNCCYNITDESVISISMNCTGLQSLNLSECDDITDKSIFSIAENCTKLQALSMNACDNITDISIIELSKHCKSLTFLDISRCSNVSEVFRKIYHSMIHLQDLHRYK